MMNAQNIQVFLEELARRVQGFMVENLQLRTSISTQNTRLEFEKVPPEWFRRVTHLGAMLTVPGIIAWLRQTLVAEGEKREILRTIQYALMRDLANRIVLREETLSPEEKIKMTEMFLDPKNPATKRLAEFFGKTFGVPDLL